MKAAHNTTQIADLLSRSKSTISCELRLHVGNRGCHRQQSIELFQQRAQVSRKASLVVPWVKKQDTALLKLHWSPEKVAGKRPVSDETMYQYVCADKTCGDRLWRNLRCQKQNRKRYAGGLDRGWRIPNGRPLRQRPVYVQGRKQVGRWECDTVVCANRKQAIVTFVGRKSGHAVMEKVSNKIPDLVGAAVIKALNHFEARINTQTYSNSKDWGGHAH